MLRFRGWLPDTFARRQYLPVGNPDTRFNYGHIYRDRATLDHWMKTLTATPTARATPPMARANHLPRSRNEG